MGYFKGHTECPKCGSKDNMAIYNDNGILNGKCFGCDHVERDMGNVKPQYKQRANTVNYENRESVETVDLINTYPVRPIEARGIELAEAKQFGVRCKVDDYGNPTAVYYPYFKAGQLVAYKKRIIATKGFSTIGDFKGSELFGSQLYSSGGKFIILTEGEDDALAARKMLRNLNKEYRVVSVPTGATVNSDGDGVIDSSLKRQLPWLMKFETVVLCLDQDPQGQALAVKLAETLAGEVNVKFMNFQHKDAKDMADHMLYREFMAALSNARDYVPDNIMRGSDVDIEWLREPLKAGIALPFPELNNKMRGLRHGQGGGELTLIVSGTGMGKSTLCREIGYYLRKAHQVRVGNVYLEEQAKKTMQAYIALDNNVPLPELRTDPDVISMEAWEKSKQELVDESVFYNHFGSLKSEKLINEMRYMNTREGCDFIILDHISLVVSGMDEGRGGERKDIDKLMTQLAAFVTVTGCHIIAVVHLKRRNGFVKKDKDGNIDRENAPYNRGGRISLDDLRGSAGLEQMAFNIIAVEGDQDDEAPDATPNTRWLRVLKNREWGDLGMADYLHYDKKTGRFR